jgi:hypothetical protein
MQSTSSIICSLQTSLQGKHLIKMMRRICRKKRKRINKLDILGSDTEDANQEPTRNIRSDSNVSQSIVGTPASVIEDDTNDDDYEKQADEVIEKVWHMFKDDDLDTWTQEAKSSDDLDIVIAKSFPKCGKVFRLTVKRNETKNKINLYTFRVSFQDVVMML